MSNSPKVERKLAAIVFTDIAGFTALSAQDEEKAFELLDLQRSILKPIVNKFKGEWLKEIGDGLLLTFPTVSGALECSIQIQKAVKNESNLNLRIGIHEGEITVRDGDVFGDDVNIASRIEPFAAVGGIAISGKVQQNISSLPKFKSKYIGQPTLKGVKQEVKIYCLISHGLPEPDFSKVSAKIEKKQYYYTKSIILPITGFIFTIIGSLIFFLNKETLNVLEEMIVNPKSVAVLPFDNYSSSPKDQYFSDGLTEVIIANLAKVRDLKVISRTSVMQYKGTTKPLKEIGKELGVAHILEGSVQRAGNMVRIVGQLIDTETDQHLWAETYDDDISNIFQLQSEIAQKIAISLKATITELEKDLISEKFTNSSEAYDLYLQASELPFMKRKDTELAIELYKKAIELDTNFVEAISNLSVKYSSLVHFGHDISKNVILDAKKYYLKAISKKPNSSRALNARALYYYWAQKNYDLALKDFNRILELEPGNSHVYEGIGYVQRRMGLWDEALTNLEKTRELNPNYGHIYRELRSMYYFIRKYNKGDALSENLIKFYPQQSVGYFAKAEKEFRKTQNIESEAEIIRNAMKFVDEREFSGYWWWYHLKKGDFEEVLKLTEGYPEIIYTQHKVNIRSAIFSYLYIYKGEPELAEKYFEEELEIIHLKLKETPNDHRFYSALGRYYAKKGDLENCIKNHEKAIELYPMSKDAFSGQEYLIQFSKSLGLLGEVEKTLEILKKLFLIPAPIHWWDLQYSPFFDKIRDFTEFQEFLKIEKEKAEIGK